MQGVFQAVALSTICLPLCMSLNSGDRSVQTFEGLRSRAQPSESLTLVAEAPASRTQQGHKSTLKSEAIRNRAKSSPPSSTRKIDTKTLHRMKLLAQLTLIGDALDTPRGLVVTIGANEFEQAVLKEIPKAQVSKIGEVLAPKGDMRVRVEGNSDDVAGESLALQRAQAVRDTLLAGGLKGNRISVKGMGLSHPIESNATANGREANRRVEVVIYGDSIGVLPIWDRTYPLYPGSTPTSKGPRQ
jgi:outer membrane protein OmpA-like peptidoglycan-associated protein